MIDYRAWFPDEKTMEYTSTMRLEGMFSYNITGKCILMMCVNITDKKDKKIYDGDILIDPELGLPPLFVVRYDAPSFCFEIYHGKEARKDLVVIMNWRLQGLEVIGNIYQDPELLDQKDW